MTSRPRPLGFWDHTIGGLGVKSGDLLEKLATEQAAGKIQPASEVEPIPAAQLRTDYPDTTFGKHAAWLDNDWKLHRIETKAGHGAGKPTAKLIEEAADKLGFVVRELGVTWP